MQAGDFVKEPKALSVSLLVSAFSVTGEKAAKSTRGKFAGVSLTPWGFLLGLSSEGARERWLDGSLPDDPGVPFP